MKYGALFENQDVLDFTHEVLTHHFTKKDGDISYYNDNQHNHEELESDLKSVGWKRNNSWDSGGHAKHYLYHHPDVLKKELKVRIDPVGSHATLRFR